MEGNQYKTLESQIDGLARAFMWLVSDLEQQELLDGKRFCRELHRFSAGRSEHTGLEDSARMIELIAQELDEARQLREKTPR